MDNKILQNVGSYIWSITDDVLRDVYVRGKYRDVILPMTVLRRLDTVLEDTKQQVLDMKASLDAQGIVEQDLALRSAAGQAFYNTSKFTMRDLKSRANQQQLKADFEAYLDGFSPNVQEILDNFEFRNQIPKLSRADALGLLIEKLTSPQLDISPTGIDNHAMGTIFEELVRKFNEENNEEAGEHWTPRDAIKLMTKLMFLPIADEIESGTYLLYDCACGTGGMLTVAEDTLQEIAAERGKQISTHLYGQEINGETYAICKSDMLLKGEGEAADNIVGGPEHSTLSADAFPGREFDFMLANPPYGKSWKTDLERMGGKKDLRDSRFILEHANDPEYSLITRSSDGQMLFLANMVSKMKKASKLGSRIAEVHNGSSLFTGDAGQGESNIRRWIIESDWLEAIVALPLNMFYNTGIATYVWVLSNRKPEHRKGKVQLIDATDWHRPLRKNLGDKNCELGEEEIEQVCAAFLDFKETEQSKIFSNAEFGYWKVTVDRPLRLSSQLTKQTWQALQFSSGDEELRSALYDEIGEDLFENFEAVQKKVETIISTWRDDESDNPGPKITEAQQKRLLKPASWARDYELVQLAPKLLQAIGGEVFNDHNAFRSALDGALQELGIKLTAASKKAIYKAASWANPEAAPVIKKVHRAGVKADPIRGLFEIEIDGKSRVVEYELDTDLRDTEQIPMLEDGGIEAFLAREVLPHAPDAWYLAHKVKIGYEISFTRYFYKPKPMRSLDAIRADILSLEQETEGLLVEIIREADT